jgi:hypothetical protein
MMRNGFTMRNACLGAVFALFGAVGLVGCGDDDDDEIGEADCSSCPESAQEECAEDYAECRGEGGTASQCQDAVEVICAFHSLGSDE